MVDSIVSVWQKALIDAALDAVIVIDEDGLILEFNRAAEASFGYRKQDVLGQPMADLIVPPRLRAAHKQGLERMRGKAISKILGQRLELPALRKDGSEFPVELIVVQVATKPRPVYVGYLRDISEEKRAQATLRASEERFRKLADTAPAMIWLSDASNERTWFNRIWLDFVGEDMESQLGQAWIQRVHPDDVDQLIHTCNQAVEGRCPYSAEFRLRHHDGYYHWILDHGTPVFDGNESYSGFAGTCIDITERRQTEEALRLTQFSVENAVDAVFWVGPHANLVYANKKACQSLGYSQEEIRQLTVLDISPEFPREEWEEHWNKLRETGGYTFETVHQRKDGSRFPVEISVNYLEAEGQQLNFAFARDLTDRREQERRVAASEGKLRAISDAAIDAVILIDPNGEIAHWNPAAEKMFGHSQSEIRNLHIDHILKACKTTPLQDWIEIGQRGQILEMFAVHRSGASFPVELSLSPAKLANQLWAVAVVRDATDRKLVEEKLKRALQAAQEANRTRAEFLALVSHEMRTPLNSILGMIELALDTKLTADQREMLATSRQSGQQLKRLINDMLDVSQIQTGRFDLRVAPFDIRTSLERIREEFEPRARAKGLEFYSHISPRVQSHVVGDGPRLEQILHNLLDNAIKFTESGHVSLWVSARNGKQDRITFLVADSGIGVAPENRERIFDRFEQEDSSSTRSFGGVGLGLSICRQLVEHMDGSITYTPGPEGGSLFSFEVVLRPEALGTRQNDNSAPTKSHRALRGKHVLLVEDDPPSRAVAARLLTKSGLRVTQAIDGLDALHQFGNQKDHFDVVLMDMMMPRLDGLEAAKRILSLQPRVPIVAMTAQAMKGDRERLLRAGLQGYLPKPIEPDAVLKTLEDVLNKSKANQQEHDDCVTASSVLEADALMRRCDGNTEFLGEVITLFDKAIDETLAVITDALSTHDKAILEKAVHRLKGTIGNMCAPQSTVAVSRLEASVRSGDMDLASVHLLQTTAALQSLRRALAHLHCSTPQVFTKPNEHSS